MQEVVYYGAGHPNAGQVKEVINHPSRPTRPVIFDSADWKEFAYAVLGAIALPESDDDDEKLLAGMDRYGAILQAARASTDNLVVAAVDQYDTEKFFRKDKTLRFLAVLNANGEIVTDAELASFNANWPEG